MLPARSPPNLAGKLQPVHNEMITNQGNSWLPGLQRGRAGAAIGRAANGRPILPGRFSGGAPNPYAAGLAGVEPSELKGALTQGATKLPSRGLGSRAGGVLKTVAPHIGLQAALQYWNGRD